MGTQHTIRHDNGKPLSCKTKQSTALSTLHTTKHMNWRDSSVTGRKPFLRLCADDSKVVCAGNSGWRELSGPARFGGGNDRKPKWKEEWSLSLPTVVVNNSYLEEVPACSLFRLCQPSVEWYSAQDSGAPTKGRGGGLTRGYVCNKRLLLSSGPGSLVNASMVRILRKGKKKKTSQKWRRVSPSFLPPLSTGTAWERYMTKVLTSPRISRCSAELGVPGTGLCVQRKSESWLSLPV